MTNKVKQKMIEFVSFSAHDLRNVQMTQQLSDCGLGCGSSV